MYSYQSFVFKIIINLFHDVPFDDISRMRFVKHYRFHPFFFKYDAGAGSLTFIAWNVSQSNKQPPHFIPCEIIGESRETGYQFFFCSHAVIIIVQK